jgi:prolyl 4-hydroxylase
MSPFPKDDTNHHPTMDAYDEPNPTQTFSSDDEEDEDYEEEEEDQLEGEDVPFWKQHFVAIMIAFVAAMIGHVYNNQSRASFSGAFMINTFLPPLENSMDRHDHLERFVRTANISFCLNAMPTMATGRLQVMDFYLPREHFPALQTYFLADQEDDAENYAELDEQKRKDDLNIVDPNYQCLLDQYLNKPSGIKLKGHTNYYKNPTMEDIYPEFAENGVTTRRKSNMDSGIMISSKERKRRLEQPPLTFTGFAAKFINLSPKPVFLYWDGKGGHENAKKLVAEIQPFQAVGTATTPGQSFHVTAVYDSTSPLQRWVVTADTALIHYEPMTPSEMQRLLLEEVKDYTMFAMYQRQLLNRAFARDYTVASGRTWLANFPRQFPMHYMHPADHIGQVHQMGEYKLKVVSVTPRVFTIENFLTPDECHEIIRLGIDKGLKPSTLHSSATARHTNDTATRSSSNTWLARDTSPLTESVYQKAAKLTNIDPELLAKFHETSSQHNSIAESLQIVRYRKSEEYTPHHDFVTPSINDRFQGTRFATMLIYLNTVTEGGETRFPRAVNNYNSQGLEIAPKAGTAVLFYNLLEDGNVDDLSQHGSNKVLGNTNKWIANLWLWDPVIG